MGTSTRPTMEQPGHFGILVVCTANICRSPLVEHLLRQALNRSTRPTTAQFTVSSAGVQGRDGSVMDPECAAELRRLGGHPEGFRARSLTVAACEQADLILTATAEHRAYVLQETPLALRRTFTVLEFAHLVSTVPALRLDWGAPGRLVRRASLARGAAELAAYDLPDPYGREPAVHRQVADTIEAAVRAVTEALAPDSC